MLDLFRNNAASIGMPHSQGGFGNMIPGFLDMLGGGASSVRLPPSHFHGSHAGMPAMFSRFGRVPADEFRGAGGGRHAWSNPWQEVFSGFAGGPHMADARGWHGHGHGGHGHERHWGSRFGPQDGPDNFSRHFSGAMDMMRSMRGEELSPFSYEGGPVPGIDHEYFFGNSSSRHAMRGMPLSPDGGGRYAGPGYPGGGYSPGSVPPMMHEGAMYGGGGINAMPSNIPPSPPRSPPGDIWSRTGVSPTFGLEGYQLDL